jgi:hypothetical protein
VIEAPVSRVPADPAANPPDLGVSDAEREGVRARITFTLIGLLALVVVLPVLGLMLGVISVNDVKELWIFLGSPMIALASTAIAFYFRSVRK